MTARCEATDALARAAYALEQMRGPEIIDLPRLAELLRPVTPCPEKKP